MFRLWSIWVNPLKAIRLLGIELGSVDIDLVSCCRWANNLTLRGFQGSIEPLKLKLLNTSTACLACFLITAQRYNCRLPNIRWHQKPVANSKPLSSSCCHQTSEVRDVNRISTAPAQFQDLLPESVLFARLQWWWRWWQTMLVVHISKLYQSCFVYYWAVAHIEWQTHKWLRKQCLTSCVWDVLLATFHLYLSKSIAMINVVW